MWMARPASAFSGCGDSFPLWLLSPRGPFRREALDCTARSPGQTDQSVEDVLGNLNLSSSVTPQMMNLGVSQERESASVVFSRHLRRSPAFWPSCFCAFAVLSEVWHQQAVLRLLQLIELPLLENLLVGAADALRPPSLGREGGQNLVYTSSYLDREILKAFGEAQWVSHSHCEDMADTVVQRLALSLHCNKVMGSNPGRERLFFGFLPLPRTVLKRECLCQSVTAGVVQGAMQDPSNPEWRRGWGQKVDGCLDVFLGFIWPDESLFFLHFKLWRFCPSSSWMWCQQQNKKKIHKLFKKKILKTCTQKIHINIYIYLKI